MSQATPCIFCQLATKRDAHVYDSDGAYAIRDIHPAAPGHTLVISRRHVPTVFDLDEPEILALVYAIRDVRNDLARDYGTDASNIVVNSGAAAGQSVFHAHAHVIPRQRDGATPGIAGLESVLSSR